MALSLVLTGCDAMLGKEVGRLPINQLSAEGNLVIKETTLDLKKDDEIAIWSDMDIECEGDVALRFKVEMLKNGEKMGGFELIPPKRTLLQVRLKQR